MDASRIGRRVRLHGRAHAEAAQRLYEAAWLAQEEMEDGEGAAELWQKLVELELPERELPAELLALTLGYGFDLAALDLQLAACRTG